MVQNHILQLLCVTAMEPPWSMDADVVRDHKIEVLRCLRPLTGKDVEQNVVRAQYGPGYHHGVAVPGYRREEGVKPNSTTETYVALKVFVDNWRWAGVPFYLRTGKRLPKRASEIAIQFKPVPEILFNRNPARRWSRTSWRSGSSPTRGSRSGSPPSGPAPRSGSGRSGWTSATTRPSATRPPRPMSGSCSTSWPATPRSS